MDLVNGAANTLLYPIMLVLYKLLVVLPNHITYYILQLINWLTGSNLMEVLLGNKDVNTATSLTNFSQTSDFFKVFGFIALVGIIIFLAALVFSIGKIYLHKKDNETEKNIKKELTFLFKRAGFALVLVAIIPLGFVLCVSAVSYIFGLLYSSQNIYFGNGSTSTPVGAFSNFVQRNWNSRERLDNIMIMNGLMVFNIWTAGYDLIGEGRTIEQALNDTSHDFNKVGHDIIHLMKGGSFMGGGPALTTMTSVDRWNVLLSALTSIVMLYLVIMFVVSVVARLIEMYFLVLIAPVVIFGGVAMEKQNGKWIIKTFHKVLTVNVAILGYFIFNIIYMLIYSTFLQHKQDMSLRMLQFVILFAGMTFVNQVPTLFMKFLNSDERVIGNEMSEAKGQLQTITAPLTTAMGSIFTGSLAMMKTAQNSSSGAIADIQKAAMPMGTMNPNNAQSFKF